MNTIIPTKENLVLEEKSLEKSIYAEGLIIKDNDMYVKAGEFLKGLKSLEDEIDADYAEPIKLANNTHKMLIALKNKYLNPVLEAKRIVTQKCLEYRRLYSIRREAEAAKIRQLAEEAAKPVLVDTEVVAGAVDYGYAGEAAVMIVPPVTYSEPLPEIKGIAPRKDWSFEIVNPNLVPIEFMIIDEKKIRGVVKALKDKCSIPGVRVFQKENLITSGN